jgi:hypothetical protein
LYSTINGVIAVWIKDAAIFGVESGDCYGTAHIPEHGGMLLLNHRFIASGCGAESETSYATSAA